METFFLVSQTFFKCINFCAYIISKLHGFALSILCKCTLSHCVPHLPPPHTHTHTHTHPDTLDVSESFLQGGCVQLPQLSSWPGQGLCHDSQQVPTGSTIGPVPWIQWREMTLHTLTGTTEQCYSIELQCRHVMCTLPYHDFVCFQYEYNYFIIKFQLENG